MTNTKMATPILEASTLVAFDNAAAGHDGVLTDSSGELVIKPCTQTEMAFYSETVANHPDFAALMPAFMGTLQVGMSKLMEDTLKSAPNDAEHSPMILPNLEESTTTTDNEDQIPVILPLKGRKLDTDMAVVLENVTFGFKRPNIMDVKLGKRLWADDAPPAKRTKFDDVSSKTTSGSLGFRVAGMRVWQGSSYKIYDKWYGRNRTEDNIVEAFEDLLAITKEGKIDEHFEDVLNGIVDAVGQIEEAVEQQESRIYSSSLLFVYEGDPIARREALEATIIRAKRDSATGLGAEAENQTAYDEDEDEDDEETAPTKKLFDVRIIDFAHATWTPGQGPDENMLFGIRSIHKILRDIAKFHETRSPR